METLTLRWAALRQSLSSSLWVLPAVGVVVGVVAAVVLGQLGDVGTSLPFVLVGSADSAQWVLATIAGSTMTVTSLTSTLTVLALQVASGQFTQRLMRTFLSDRGNQVVLAVFMGTFAYSLTLLQTVQSASDQVERSVPAIGVTVAVLAALASVSALVYFIHHLTAQLRVDKVMSSVGDTTVRLIEDSFEPSIIDDNPPTDIALPERHVVVTAPRSGYLTGVATDQLVQAAADQDVSVRLRPTGDEWVVAGTTLAWVWPNDPAAWPPDDDPDDDPDADAAADLDERATRVVVSNVHLSSSRSVPSEASFGIRQLVDIAIRALSLGVNDPTTAVDALRQVSRIMASLGQRDLGSIVRFAGGGIVFLPRPDFASHLRLATDQVLRYGHREPAVLRAMAMLLHDVAEVCHGSTRHEAIADEARLVDATLAAADLSPQAAGPVRDALDAVHAVIAGRPAVLPPHAD